MQFPPSGNTRGAVSAMVEIPSLGTDSSCQNITYIMMEISFSLGKKYTGDAFG